MGWRSGVLALLAVTVAGTGSAQAQGIASAAVDASIYRPGEVQRIGGRFEAWWLVCDDVTRLRQRFCSLSANALRAGHAVARLTISTGDDGRPAVMADLPVGVMVTPGVTIALDGPGPVPALHVPVALCHRDRCSAVATLPPALLAGLQAGRVWRVRFALASVTPSVRPSLRAHGIPQFVEGVVAGQGFAAAVQASLR